MSRRPRSLGEVVTIFYRFGVRITRIGPLVSAPATTVGIVLVAGGLSLVPAAFVDLFSDDGHVIALMVTGIGLCVSGTALLFVFRMPARLSTDQLYRTLVSAALAMIVAGAVVHLATGAVGRIDRALIEATAGVTTTAVSNILLPENLSRGEQLYRSLMQWGAGAGAIVAIVRVFPRLGIGGLDAEGGVATRAASRLSPTVGGNLRRLGAVYAVFTLIIAVAYGLAGMPSMDAFLHGLTTVSTGGWSTRAGSIGAFDSAAVEWVAAGAMFGAGISLPYAFQVLRTGRFDLLWRSVELRVYVSLTLVSWLMLVVWSGDLTWTAVRRALFAVTSAMSTTGMLAGATTVFDEAGSALLVLLVVVGGMAASLTGGIRIARALVLIGVIRRELVRQVHASVVKTIRVGSSSVGDEAVGRMVGEVVLNLLAVGAGFAVLASAGVDVRSAMGTAASMLATAGPAYGSADQAVALTELDTFGRISAAVLMFVGQVSVLPVVAVVASVTVPARRHLRLRSRGALKPAARR